MPGKTFSPSVKNAEAVALTSTQTQHLSGLLSDPREHMAGMTPQLAYQNGFSMSLALKAQRRELKILLLAELERLARHVNATRTFQTQTDLQDAVDDICELFPSLKVEEVLTAFKHIRQGRFQLYGNFTTNTLLDCIRQYDMQNTVPMREQEHYEKKKTVQTASLDVRRLINDLNRDGKLKTSRQLLDRKYIPYPNDQTDAYETKSTEHDKKEAPPDKAQKKREGSTERTP